MKIINIQSYSPQKGECYIIDTNIWFYLFFPIAGYSSVQRKPYEEFFDKAIKNNSVFQITSSIVSELINRYFRLEFNILKNRSSSVIKDFKQHYRGTKEFVENAKTLRIILNKNILRISNPIDDSFSSIDLKTIINALDHTDFTDEYLIHLAKFNNSKIITNDFDFGLSTESVVVLTANQKLINYKPH